MWGPLTGEVPLDASQKSSGLHWGPHKDTYTRTHLHAYTHACVTSESSCSYECQLQLHTQAGNEDKGDWPLHRPHGEKNPPIPGTGF